MGPTWVLSAPDGPHVGPMKLAIRDVLYMIIKCGSEIQLKITDIYFRVDNIKDTISRVHFADHCKSTVFISMAYSVNKIETLQLRITGSL